MKLPLTFPLLSFYPRFSADLFTEAMKAEAYHGPPVIAIHPNAPAEWDGLGFLRCGVMDPHELTIGNAHLTFTSNPTEPHMIVMGGTGLPTMENIEELISLYTQATAPHTSNPDPELPCLSNLTLLSKSPSAPRKSRLPLPIPTASPLQCWHSWRLNLS